MVDPFVSPTRVLAKQRLFLSDAKLPAGLTAPVHDKMCWLLASSMQCHKTVTWQSHRLQMTMVSVHLKSDLYLDGVGVACVASLLSVHADLKTGLEACVQSEHTPTDTTPVLAHFRFLFTEQASVSRTVVHHAFAARPGCSRALGHSLCGLPPLKPPLIVLGTVVQVFSSLRGLCSMLPWHSMIAAPCHVPLPPCSAT